MAWEVTMAVTAVLTAAIVWLAAADMLVLAADAHQL
jgi:hypothetical protein